MKLFHREFMKYLLLAVFALIIPFFNNFLFAETEFSIDTILTRNVTSLTYNSKNENVYVALDPDRIAIINSKTNNVTNIIKNLEIFPNKITYDPVNGALYLFGDPMAQLKSNISIIDGRNNTISKTYLAYSDSENKVPGNLLSNIVYNSNKSIYIINPWNESVAIIDPSAYNVTKYLPIKEAVTLTFNPSNNFLYVANIGSIYVVDSSTNEVIKNIPIKVGLPKDLIYNPSNGNIYATLQDPSENGIVMVINSSTNEVIKNIPIGKFPFNLLRVSGALAYNPSNKHVYVALNDSISLINSSNEIVKNISFNNTGNPLQIGYNPSNSDLYIGIGSKKIAILNSTTNNVTHIIENLQGYPTGIAFNPENKMMELLVQNKTDPLDKLRFLKINLTINKISTILKNFEDRDLPSAIAFNPENKKIYVTDIVDSKSISVIDPYTENVIKNIQISDQNYSHGNLLYNPSNGYVYATSITNNTNTLTVIDPSTNNVVKNIQLAKVADRAFRNDIIHNPSNGYIYILNRNFSIGSTNTGFVGVIDPSTNNVIKNIPIGDINGDIGTIIHNPSNGYIYIMSIYNNETDNYSVAVIDPSTNNVIKNIPIGETDTLFGDLLYNPSNSYVYVTSIINDTGTVSIIDSFTNNVVKIIPIGESDITLDRNLIYNPSNGYIYLSGAQKLYVIKHKEIHK